MAIRKNCGKVWKRQKPTFRAARKEEASLDLEDIAVAGFRIRTQIEKLHVARRGRFEFAVCGPGTLQFTGGAAAVHDQMHKEHQHEDAAEGNHDGGAGGRVKLDAEVATERRNQGAHGPTNR